MAKVIIDTERCKGCGLCARNCPREIIRISQDMLNNKGYHPAQVYDMEQCIACASCARTCPDVVITVFKEEREAV